MTDKTRRTFLISAGTLGLSACMHTNAARIVATPAVSGAIQLRLADQPELAAVGGAVKLEPPGGEKILLWRSGPSEFSATSIRCTHMGCEVEVADGGRDLACPCHGSRYAADGTVTHGPASRPLRHYAVDSNGTDLTVHVG